MICGLNVTSTRNAKRTQKCISIILSRTKLQTAMQCNQMQKVRVSARGKGIGIGEKDATEAWDDKNTPPDLGFF